MSTPPCQAGRHHASLLGCKVAVHSGPSLGASWIVCSKRRLLAFDALSGASAGAVNAVLLASGLLEGGRLEGKARLERFWRRMSASAALGPQGALAMTPLGAAMRMLSPYQFNPFNLNPLRDALVEEVDFARLRAEAPVKLLIAATRVSDGRQRIFRENELTADMVLASTCLPLLHHAVNIDGEDYWDGGYVANPPLFPLALASEAVDISGRAGDTQRCRKDALEPAGYHQASRANSIQRHSERRIRGAATWRDLADVTDI